MRFLSLFSGIEAASVAWVPLGWECVAVAEIEPFPSAVLKHHYPKVPNLGDVTKITQQQIEALGHIDVVIYGFPCQDLSVAGNRKGLKHADGTNTRSGLFYIAANIIKWSRARWSVAENVPGLFSSNGGCDFASVVGELAGAKLDVPADGWRNSGVALGGKGLVEWTTLDAQFFGVPQKRRRVFIVRDTGDWQSREPLFLVPYSLQGHPAPSRETGQRVAATVSASPPSRRNGGSDPTSGHFVEIAPAITGNPYADNASREGLLVPHCMSTGQAGSEIGIGIGTTLNCNHEAPIVTHSLRGEGFDASEDGTGRRTPLVPVAIQERAVSENLANGPQGKGYQEHIAYTLEARNKVQAVAYQTSGNCGAWETGEQIGALTSGTDPNQRVIAFSSKDHGADAADISPTLRSMGHDGSHANGGSQVAPAVAFNVHSQNSCAMKGAGPSLAAIETRVSRCLDGAGFTEQQGGTLALGPVSAVRRLTPRECARLQGFPDDFLDITFRGKPAADGPKYKALGNSMAVPVIRWIGEIIAAVSAIP